VAAEARRVAEIVGENAIQAETAGWLHDCSALFPALDRANIAHQWGIPVLPEEERLPMIVHQKLSRILAAEVFGVNDVLVLDAVECHTTLKANPTRLDKVLFVADKIAWDQDGIAPYYHKLVAALEQSLDHAVFVYLKYLWDRRHTLKVFHPWAREAYLQMSM
jgi:predicted HD superfamily hydrolase involved in NAD metabolism